MRMITTLFVVFALVQTAVAQESDKPLSRPKPAKAEASARESRVFRIENIAVLDLAKAISDELEPQLEQKPKHDGVVIESPIVIVPEVTTNSLLVSANSAYMKQVTGLIEKLDKRPQPLMLRLKIQEVDAEGNVTTLSEPILVTTERREASIKLERNRKTLKIEITPTLVEQIGEK